MGAQRIHLFLSLMVGFLLTFEGEAQVTFDLEVQVVMDTVLYDGYQGAEDFIAEGSRRYKLYAVLPSPDAIMLGPAADSDSDPAIPGFGFDAACGCYNWESIFVPDGYNSGSSINAGFYALAPELVYDTWWTTHVGTQTPGTTVFQAPGTFPIDFDACSDLVTQGALVVTNADPHSCDGAKRPCADWPDHHLRKFFIPSVRSHAGGDRSHHFVHGWICGSHRPMRADVGSAIQCDPGNRLFWGFCHCGGIAQ